MDLVYWVVGRLPGTPSGSDRTGRVLSTLEDRRYLPPRHAISNPELGGLPD